MSVVAAAIVGSTVVGAGASVYSSREQSKASEKAAKAQGRAADARISFEMQDNFMQRKFLKELYDIQREDLAPWREVGEQALSQLQEGIASGQFDPGSFQFDFEHPGAFSFDFQADPGYAFRKQEGINALDASAAARGRLLSGAQDKAITRYGQNFASNEYQNAYSRALTEHGLELQNYGDRFNREMSMHQLEAARGGDQYNRLAGIAGIGQTATQMGQQASGQYGAGVSQAQAQTQSSIGQTMTHAGQAQAQNYLNQGAARAGAYQGVAGSAQQGIQNYLLYNYLQGGG